MRKQLFVFIVFSLFFSKVFADNSVAFYVVAHQDDWQLFMGLDAYNAMNDSNSTKVVIIHTTAGDASCGGAKLNKSYYMAREQGAIYSIEFAMDIKSQHGRNNFDTVNINGHNIKRYQYKNVVDYFFRLPDGCMAAGLHGQSLEYLKNGKNAFIMAVDSSAVYNSWDDLVSTMRCIIQKEMDTCNNVWLNVAETDRDINPNDHPDHLQTAMAALEATAAMDNIRKHFFTEYHVKDMPVNLEPDDVALKAALYGVAEFGREQNNVGSSWSREHIDYLTRNYYRTAYSRIDSALNGGDMKSPQQCILYPNPAVSTINFTYKMEKTGNIIVNIADINGQVVMPVLNTCKSTGCYEKKINVSALAPGNYFVLISTPTYQKTISMTKL